MSTGFGSRCSVVFGQEFFTNSEWSKNPGEKWRFFRSFSGMSFLLGLSHCRVLKGSGVLKGRG